MTDFRRLRNRVLIPLLIVIGGAVIMNVLVRTRKRPTRTRNRAPGALVEVMSVAPEDRRVIIEGNGTVSPRYEVILQPQVTGKVVWIHPELVSGHAFELGDELVRIDPADYELAVRRAEAQVAQAEYQLDVTQANAAIAHREWELMNDSAAASGSEPDPLVLHEPQLRQARAILASAQAALETTQLNLSRTVLRAPFDCRVRSQAVAPGQLVSPASQMASLYATDVVEIEVGLPVADVAWLEIPGANARVTLETGDGEYRWTGTVHRAVGVSDQIGRLARVVVRVTEPFARQPELSIGSFVWVAIEGREVTGTLPIPRRALREESTVWIANADNQLAVREVVIERLTADEALVRGGLAPGDRIIMTALSGAAPGMPLRIKEAGER